MVLIKWDDKLLINNEEIDSQHKKLFKMTNSLHKDLLTGSGDAVLGNLLISLVDYIKVHFDTEEKLMEKSGYPDKEEHIKAHKEFISKVKSYIVKYKNKTPLLAREILIFLKNWYEGHIIHIDKKFGIFLENSNTITLD